MTFYNGLLGVYNDYQAELKRHMAYNDAVKAEMEKDEMAQDAYFMETLGLVVPRATGRDDMLHPYVVNDCAEVSSG